MIDPIKYDELPPGAMIVVVEDVGENKKRVVVFDRDEETGALSVLDIMESDNYGDLVDCLKWQYEGQLENFWFPVDGFFHQELGYLQSHETSLTECLEACFGLPPRRNHPRHWPSDSFFAATG